MSTADQTVVDVPPPDGAAGRVTAGVTGAVAAARRAPFTAAVVAAMVAIGLATGSFWSPLSGRGYADQLAYGLPAFAEGHWWTVVTGSLLAGHPALYLLTLVLFAVAVGWAELRIGTGRTAVVCVAGQLAGILLGALVVWALAATPWGWANALALDLDTGFSAGMFAVLAVTSSTVRAPWRLRLRLVLVGYVLVGLLYLAQLADLEHAIALARGAAARAPDHRCRRPGSGQRSSAVASGAWSPPSGWSCWPRSGWSRGWSRWPARSVRPGATPPPSRRWSASRSRCCWPRGSDGAGGRPGCWPCWSAASTRWWACSWPPP